MFKIKYSIGVWIGILVAVIGVLVWSSGIYLEFLKIQEIGKQYTNVFFTNFKIRAIAQIIVFVVVLTIFLIGNIWLRRNLRRWDSTGVYLDKNLWLLIVSVAISIFGASFIGENVFSKIVPAFNPTWFNTADPVFGKNIGYYVFIRPLLVSITDSLMGIFVLYAVYIAIVYGLYYIRNGVRHPKEMLFQKGIILHLASSLLACFVVGAVRFIFTAEDLLFTQHGELIGGGFTDITLWLNVYRVMPFVLIAIVIGAIYFLLKGRLKLVVGVTLLYPALWIVAAIVALMMQNLIVKPTEASQERPFIRNNIDYTRAAYNLDTVDEQEYPIYDNLNQASIKQNAGTLENVRVTDYPSTLAGFNQLQSLRNYYRFKDADIVPYNINGKKRAVYISARELEPEGIGTKQLSYVNLKMRYTHGYGVVMSPVNEVTAEGQPSFLMQDIPVKSDEGLPEVKQPRIYFGESSNDNVIVNSYQKELDYAEGQTEYESNYTGKAGILLNPINKLLFSMWNSDLNLLTSGYISPESKILTNRNVLNRVREAVPFIQFDGDPYIIIDGSGGLKWIIDGYTSTKYYPYSQYSDGINYIRNSVKAVVDAYDGTVEMYINDTTDPIIRTYAKAYPGVFKEGGVPADIAEHIRYSERLFKIQSYIYNKYHTTNPATFYARSDLWDFAREKYGAQSEIKPVDPYYNLMPVSSGEQQLVLMLPFTPATKDNELVAWLSAYTDGVNGGKLMAYRFPHGKHVYGTLQIENKIDSDPKISSEMKLWNQGGSSVVRGNTLVIPVSNSIMYIEPIYITSQNQASLPEMKRVVVAYRDSVVMEKTLSEAIKKILSVENGQAQPQVTPIEVTSPLPASDLQELLEKALTKYGETKQFTKENDYVNYGKSMKEFDDLMKELQRKSAEHSSVQTPAPLASPQPTP